MLFEPKAVALIGSSKLREKVGMTSPLLFRNVTYNMTKFFNGKTYVVDIHSRKSPRKIEEISETPQLAVLMLPPRESVIYSKECAEKGVKTLLLITGGYKESQRRQLLEIKNEYGTRMLGPNTIMGVLNTSNGLNTTFEKGKMPKKGSIAVISQSGGVGACLLDWACYYEVGISKFVFMGDKIDIDDIDVLKYLKHDVQTKVVCIYMEGIQKGREFIELAKEVVKTKPILVLKGGVTQEAAKRAKSHTASMAGADEIFNAAFKKAGIIRVEDVEELLNSAIALAMQPPLKGDNIAVVSNVGGPAILAADAIARNNLKLAVLSPKIKKEIEKRFPGVDATNPIDLIADARADRFKVVLDLVLSDSKVDGVMVINMLKSTFFKPEDAWVIAETAKKYPNKPVVDVPAGGEDFVSVHEVLKDTYLPLYNLPEKAAKALKALRVYAKIKGK
jgi:acyl-CoA synthetase (NDP forming)